MSDPVAGNPLISHARTDGNRDYQDDKNSHRQNYFRQSGSGAFFHWFRQARSIAGDYIFEAGNIQKDVRKPANG